MKHAILGYTKGMGTSNTELALITDLNAQLEKARHAYYVLAEPIMTDAAYDALEASFRALVETDKKDIAKRLAVAPALLNVGSDIGKGVRVAHVRPMLSIENKYTKDEVVEFVLSLPSGSGICIEPKHDGISCELRYRNGTLVQALTRGTGSEGEDMTAQVLALASIPKELNKEAVPSMLHIRGELVMRDGELNRINAAANGGKTYASTRNLTAGTMKQKDLSIVASRNIEFLPWDVYSYAGDVYSPAGELYLEDSNYSRMKFLSSLGFSTYEGFYVDSPTDVKAYLDKVLDLNSKSDIRADGVVIKVDSHKLRKELGVASKFTNWMTCFKPQSESGTTYLRRIIWQGGRSGKLTPVAECDPVVLAGAVVTRATLNNETWIATMGLKLGAKVEMLRSGDVIPQIVKVLDDTGEDIVLPTECPECASELVIHTDKSSSITTRWCDSGDCPGRIRDLFTHIGSREILEIDGLANDMADRLVKGEYARTLGELFQFQVETFASYKKLQEKYGHEEGEQKFLERMASQGFNVTVLKMLKSMEAAKTAGWDKWIPALGIPAIGRTLGKLLAKELKLESGDMATLCMKLEEATKRNIEGMGDVKSEILRNWSLDPTNRDICTALFESGVRPTPLVNKAADGIGQPLAGMAFCITGEFGEDRDKLTQKLESLGAVAKSGVSKNITHLIVGDSAGKSKLAKYDELVGKGLKIEKVGKDWLAKTLSDAGMGMKASTFSVEEV